MSEEIRDDQILEEEVTGEPENPDNEPATDEEPEATEATDNKEPTEMEPEKPKSDHVPLNKYMAEKKRRQELEKLFAQQEAEREKIRIAQEYMSQGYPEQTALYHANQIVSQRQEANEVKAKLLDFEVRDLAKSDPFFADAETYKDEIKGKMRELKCSAEEAYMLLRGRSRTREYQLEQEQRAVAKRRKATTKKVENASPDAPKNPYPLDEHDEKALAELQKAMPDAGWTREKYYKMMKT